MNLTSAYLHKRINFISLCRCRAGKGKLAGIGRNCGRIRYSRPSCISYGRIDVYQRRDEIPKQDSCSYTEGKTTGVLCCRRFKSKSEYIAVYYKRYFCQVCVLLKFFRSVKTLNFSRCKVFTKDTGKVTQTKKFVSNSRKHCERRRFCCLPAFSYFFSVFKRCLSQGQ